MTGTLLSLSSTDVVVEKDVLDQNARELPTIVRARKRLVFRNDELVRPLSWTSIRSAVFSSVRP